MDAVFNYSVAICGLIALITLCVFGIRAERNWVTPLALVSLWVFLSVALDGSYMLFSGDYGLREDNRLPLVPYQFAEAILLWLLSMVCFTAFYFLIPQRKILSSFKESKLARSRRTTPSFHVSERMALATKLLLVLGALLSLFVMMQIYLRAAQMGISLVQIPGARNRIASDGGGIFLLLLQFYKYIIIISFFQNFGTNRFNWGYLSAHLLLSVACDLFVGSRSAVIYGTFLPLLIGYHVFHRPIALHRLMIPTIVIAILISPLYRSVARDQFFSKNENLSLAQILISNVTNMPKMVYGGFEVSSLDALVDVISHYQNGLYDLQKGETLLMSPASLIPRALWPEKPYGGASTIFTQTFYGQYYGSNRSELLTSLPGELYMNFGFWGSPLVFAVLGAAMGVLKRVCFPLNTTPDRITILFFVVIMMRVFSLLRADSFNFVYQVFWNVMPLIITLSIYRFVVSASGMGIGTQKARSLRPKSGIAA